MLGAGTARIFTATETHPALKAVLTLYADGLALVAEASLALIDSVLSLNPICLHTPHTQVDAIYSHS